MGLSYVTTWRQLKQSTLRATCGLVERRLVRGGVG